MDFIDIRLPIDVSANAIGGPEFSTTVNITKGQGEFRNINWHYPRYRYTISYNIKNQSQVMEMIALFNICKGKGCSFRYKDWSDFKAKDETLGVGDGKKMAFSFHKQYKIGDFIALRQITKLVSGTVFIYVDSKPFAENGIDIDYNAGKVTFAIAPAVGTKIAATFEFDVQVRFDSDFLPIKMVNNHHYILDNIMLTEVRQF